MVGSDAGEDAATGDGSEAWLVTDWFEELMGRLGN